MPKIEFSGKGNREAAECLAHIQEIVMGAARRAGQRAADLRTIAEGESRQVPHSEGVKIRKPRRRGLVRDLVRRLVVGRCVGA